MNEILELLLLSIVTGCIINGVLVASNSKNKIFYFLRARIDKRIEDLDEWKKKLLIDASKKSDSQERAREIESIERIYLKKTGAVHFPFNPLILCPACMASIWGSFCYLFYFNSIWLCSLWIILITSIYLYTTYKTILGNILSVLGFMALLMLICVLWWAQIDLGLSIRFIGKLLAFVLMTACISTIISKKV